MGFVHILQNKNNLISKTISKRQSNMINTILCIFMKIYVHFIFACCDMWVVITPTIQCVTADMFLPSCPSWWVWCWFWPSPGMSVGAHVWPEALERSAWQPCNGCLPVLPRLCWTGCRHTAIGIWVDGWNRLSSKGMSVYVVVCMCMQWLQCQGLTCRCNRWPVPGAPRETAQSRDAGNCHGDSHQTAPESNQTSLPDHLIGEIVKNVSVKLCNGMWYISPGLY